MRGAHEGARRAPRRAKETPHGREERRIEIDRSAFAEGARACLPVLVGVVPFGVITGVAMVASGISPLAAMAASIFVYAGASMLASAQLLAQGAPALLVVAATFFINLRFMMYSASLRPLFAALPLRWRLAVSYLVADNAYGLTLMRFSERRESDGFRLWYFLGTAGPIWLVWQAAVLGGVLIGAGVPAAWRLEFAAPLAFIAMTVPFLRSRAMIAAALAAGTTMVLANALPLRLNVLLAAVAGIAAGLACERRP